MLLVNHLHYAAIVAVTVLSHGLVTLLTPNFLNYYMVVYGIFALLVGRYLLLTLYYKWIRSPPVVGMVRNQSFTPPLLN
jgi:hypothetical protein